MSETLGKLLSAQRLKQGLTVEEVAAKTRINAKFIRSAESDRFDQFPGVVFVKGFLRTYADILDLDPDDVVARYEALNIRDQDRSPNLISMPLHHKPALSGGSLLLIVFLVFAAGVWGFFYMTSGQENAIIPAVDQALENGAPTAPEPPSAPEGPERETQREEAPSAETETATAAPRDEAEQAAPQSAQETTEETAEKPRPEPSPPAEEEEEAAPQAPSPSPEAIEGIRDSSRPYGLTISAESDTWIKTMIDGEVTREIILRQGSTVTWWAEKGFDLSIGNVAGTRVYLNNEPVELGSPRSNVIMNLVLPRHAAESREGRKTTSTEER
ncbi:MAG: RodZ domain-containing protein [Candidatus Nitrospinota bacterium M3_3B_026]